MENVVILFKNSKFFSQVCVSALALFMLLMPVNAAVIDSFQKISSLVGGFTEAGGVLENNDDLGESLSSIGDVDGDGVIDLAVGARRDDDGGEDRGAVYIFFMRTNGTVDRIQKISSTEGGLASNLLDDIDSFGQGITDLGDVDGDGILDIAVGAGLDDDGGSDRGAVYILFLNNDGTVKQHQKISSTTGGFTGQLADNNWFGSDVESLGDFDNDGVPDLIVSQELDDDGGTNRGAIWLLFLNTDGTVKGHQKISDLAGGFTGDIENQDRFGQSSTILGDLNNDGVTDIAVGAANDDDGGENRGAVYILFMNSDGTVNSHQKISNSQGNFTGLLENGDEFGQALSIAGDLNSDGIVDIVVGAEQADSPNGVRPGTGETWILYLNSDGTVLSSELITSESTTANGGIFERLDEFDTFGQAVTFLGDLNNDGINDIAVSADGDGDCGSQCGAVYILFLNDGNSPNTNNNGVFQQSSENNRLLVLEAENFNNNIAREANTWGPLNDDDASRDFAMQANPNNGTSNSTNYVTESPRLDFEANFVARGTHFVWIRGFGTDLGSDSVHAGLNGIDLRSSRRIDDFIVGTWDWSSDIQTSPGVLQRATIDIPSTGVHTLNIWMREDGFRIDKILLTTDPNFVPTGPGPSESPIEGGNTEPEPTINSGPIFASTLPASRSVQVNQTATAFASIINSSTSEQANNCSIALGTAIHSELSYQATDEMNMLISSPNVGATIAAGAIQNFVISFTPTLAFAPNDVVLTYDCDNTDAAESTVGLNTILLSADLDPIPDIVGLTTVVDLFAPQDSTSLFAVGSANVGTTGDITVSIDDNGRNLPLSVNICQTDAGGVCLASPSPSVNLNYAEASTASFAIFVNTTGAIANDPANNRIFIRFTDSDGIIRGATSTAVRTQ